MLPLDVEAAPVNALAPPGPEPQAAPAPIEPTDETPPPVVARGVCPFVPPGPARKPGTGEAMEPCFARNEMLVRGPPSDKDETL